MDIKSEEIKDIVRICKNKEMPHIFDVDLEDIAQIKKYSSFECHIVVYPYSRKITSQNISFFPFEEYVKDILTRQRSAYTKIIGRFNNIFGLILGLIIIVIFIKLKPDDLFSVESIVSIFGAYMIGKELWDDIENIGINISKNWKIRYTENYYLYQLEKKTTLANYFHFAKRHRYGKSSLLPEKMDFIQQSNSQTVRMYFDMKDLQTFKESLAHILSIHISPSLLDEFEKDGFMFGVKLSFNKKFLFITQCFELFQSLSKNSKGCLNEKGEWAENGIFYRQTYTIGRFKYFRKDGLINNKSIIGL